MSHGNNTYPTYKYMVNYRQYPPKSNGWACKPGKAKMTYVDNPVQDTGLGNTSEQQTIMMDRGCWKGCVFNAGRPERQRPR